MILVVAAVLEDASGRILLAQRPAGKHLAGTWEFPGGKLDPGETPAQALARELAEELGIRVQACEPLLSLTHAYPDRIVRLLLRRVTAWEGEPESREAQALAWVNLEQAVRLPMPAADRPMLKALALDPRYVIDAAPSGLFDRASFLLDWEARLQAGYRWLQFSAPGLAEDALLPLAKDCGRLAQRHGARWLLQGPPSLVARVGAHGLHLSAADLRASQARPLDQRAIVCACCHDPADLHRAGELGLDFVILSPAHARSPRADLKAPDWREFDALCAQSPLPVLAFSGLGSDDLAIAREHGAFGVAGMSGCAP